jgi:hypothetical protein
MPTPEDLAPLAAHLVRPDAALRGQILFAGGSEVATVDPPHLVEVVRTEDVGSLDAVLDGFVRALVAAEDAQATTGGANPRFAGLFGASPEAAARPDGGGRTALIVTDRAGQGATLAHHLAAAGMTTEVIDAEGVGAGFDGARAALALAASALGGVDAVVRATALPHVWGDDWTTVLAAHGGLAEALHADAAWNRAAADHATDRRPVRVVHLDDASTAGGRSRAQANAQLARVSRKATGDRVAAFAVAVEDPTEIEVAAALAARLATTADASLSGAELAVGSGWLGLRSHPRPGASLVYGGPELPSWFDAVLGELQR